MGYAAINAPLLPTPNTPLQPLFLNASPLEILVKKEVVAMEDGGPTSSAIKGTDLLRQTRFFTSSMDPPTVTID